MPTDEKKKRLDRVLALRLERERIEAELRTAVRLARDPRPGTAQRWASWKEVGEMLGMSAPGANKAYLPYCKPERIER